MVGAYVQVGRGWKGVPGYVIQGNGCWDWVGSLLPTGYGRIRVGRLMVNAHRYMFERSHGPIATGLVVDHLCNNRQCVNPDHLAAVTQQQNVRRAFSSKTHCKHGHPLSGENLYRLPSKPTARGCRVCRSRYDRTQYLRRKTKRSG